jgi:Na+-translocating ferredoxin:NAD+ oxidoreductase RnfC subunit
MVQMSVDTVQACGVVGAGGAGFPSHVKFKASADTVILNAAECEPLLHKDKEMMRAFPDEIIGGMERLREMVGAKEAVIGVKGKYHDVIDIYSSRIPSTMRIVPLADSYPTGDEFILVYDVTGRIIPPGKIPLAVNVVVTNVETVYNAARNLPVTEKFLSVAGAVNNPVTVRVPVGVTYAEAIEMAGGASVSDPAALVGGVMMGKLALDLDQPITKTTGGLIVLPKDHQLIRRYSQTWKQISVIGASACDQCSFCTEFCPRYLLGHPIEPHKAMRSLEFSMIGEANVIGTQFCCECNICTMIACPEDLDPKNVCTQNKRRLASEGKKWETEANPVRAELHLDNRRVPISRLIRKLGLIDYENKGPLLPETITPRRVTLPLQQHIGAPCEPVVGVGDTVKVGDLVGQPPEGKLGAVIHASLAGRVAQVNGNIVIEA